MKRRSNGEGSVYKRKNGKWRGMITDGYDASGKLQRISFSGDTKNEVVQKIHEYTEMRKAGIICANDVFLSEWIDTWYSGYRTQVQASTYANYKYTANTIKKHLGKMPLKDILPMHIDAMLDSLTEAGYSASKIRKCRAMLIQVFDSAAANNLIVRNPARLAKKIRNPDEMPDADVKKKDAFTPKEIDSLTEKLSDDLLGNSIRLMLNTGLRTQEVLALAKEDIAEDGSTIKVCRAIKTVNGCPVIGSPKSKRSYRIIPVPKSAQQYALRVRQLGSHPYIWSNQGSHELYGVGSFRRRYYTALKKLDVRPLPPHCCRHTYITRLEAKGIPMEIIASLAGHSEINTTGNYLHISMDTLASAVSSINQ